ncbi:MAG TPA: hypothetical protein VEA92_03620 [Candidatus Paceibacterota bacterium]|nr:hypothetical protein [Candidatus Paceibacterota bacterium]
MITPEVVLFIKGQDAKGVSREATRALLASQGGWSQENLDEAFAAVPSIFAAPTAATPNPPPPVTIAEPEKPKSNILASIGATVAVLGVFVASAAAAYYFIPSIQQDIEFISGAMGGT